MASGLPELSFRGLTKAANLRAAATPQLYSETVDRPRSVRHERVCRGRFSESMTTTAPTENLGSAACVRRPAQRFLEKLSSRHTGRVNQWLVGSLACGVLFFAGCGDSPELGTAVLARAEDQALVVIDVGSGEVVYQREGPYLSTSVAISRDGTNVVGIGQDESVTRIDLKSGEEEQLQPQTGFRSTSNRFGNQSNWFIYATGLDENHVVAEDATQGRLIPGVQVVESTESGDLAYLDYASGSLVIEEPDGTARVERPLSSGRFVLAFIGDAVLVVESVEEDLVLRERNRQGELVRELGAGATSPTHRDPVPISQDGSRILLSSESALVELDLTSGERRELLSGGGDYHAAYAADDSVVVLERTDDGATGFQFSLALVTSSGTRRDFFEDRDQCNSRIYVSPDSKHLAVRCGAPAVLEFYDIESGAS